MPETCNFTEPARGCTSATACWLDQMCGSAEGSCHPYSICALRPRDATISLSHVPGRYTRFHGHRRVLPRVIARAKFPVCLSEPDLLQRLPCQVAEWNAVVYFACHQVSVRKHVRGLPRVLLARMNARAGRQIARTCAGHSSDSHAGSECRVGNREGNVRIETASLFDRGGQRLPKIILRLAAHRKLPRKLHRDLIAPDDREDGHRTHAHRGSDAGDPLQLAEVSIIATNATSSTGGSSASQQNSAKRVNRPRRISSDE